MANSEDGNETGNDDESTDQNDGGDNSGNEDEANDDGSDDSDEGAEDAGDDDSGDQDEDGDEENDPDPSDDPEEPEEEDGGEDGAGEPSLNLDQTEVAQGASLQVDGAGFEPETSIQLVATHAESDESLETVLEDTALTDSADEENPGSFSTSLDIPEDAALGEYNLVATSEAGDVVTTSFTVVESADEGDDEEDEIAEPTLTASHDQITLDEFVGSLEDEPGVHFTVEGLEAGTTLNYDVEGPGDLEDLDGSTTVGDDETAGFFIYGFDSVSDPTVYVGDYSVTVTYEDEAEEDQEVGTHEFTVVDERPQIELESGEVYQGGALEVEVSNLEPEGEVTFDWNPEETMTADADGYIATELPIAEDAEPGVHKLTVTDETSGASNSVEYTVLEADVVEPSLVIDPETITLEEFIGDPDEGAGVVHVVQELEPGTEITYTVTGPEGVNDFEQTRSVDENGVLEFVIHGFEGPNPEVYLGEYTTVVTFVNEEGETEELTGSFTVVTGDDALGSGGDEQAEPAGGTSADINGTNLAQTGATSGQLALIAGGLLLLGGAFVVFANRARLFGRKH